MKKKKLVKMGLWVEQSQKKIMETVSKRNKISQSELLRDVLDSYFKS